MWFLYANPYKRWVHTSASLFQKPPVMPSETVSQLLESDVDFDETELTLRLPGAESRPKEGNNRSNAKRGFQNTIEIDLSVGSCGDNTELELISSGSNSSSTSIDNASKLAVTGWPPVRSYRRKTMIETNCNFKYVKVAVDGAPYLRKIDLEMFKSYKELLKGLEKLCACFPICCDYLEECNNISNPMKGADHEYLPTYEDKDGDWMLVGDVPWKLFIESCKRIRLMKGSDTIGIAPITL